VRNTDWLARDELANWDFGQAETRIRGTAQVPIGDHVRLLSDGPEASFLRLGLPAQSAIVLPFRAELVEGEPRLSIELYVQAGARALLPNGGRVTLDILFDGAEQWRDTPVAIRGSPYMFVVNAHEAKMDRELVLRLGPSSTTTLRIFTVRVRRHP
jgi:hypothetical protein